MYMTPISKTEHILTFDLIFVLWCCLLGTIVLTSAEKAHNAPVNVNPQGAPGATQGLLTDNFKPTQGTLTLHIFYTQGILAKVIAT